MERTEINPRTVVDTLRRLGWQVVTSGGLLTADLGRVNPRPLFRAWGHPRYPKHQSLYAITAESPTATTRRLRSMWSAGAHDIWVVGAVPSLSTWETLSGALRGVPAGYRVLCARPDEAASGFALAIVSREPAWVTGPSEAPNPYQETFGLGYSETIRRY